MNYAIILSAGKGMRIGANKVFISILNKPMLYYSLKIFEECKLIDSIILVAQKNDFKKINEIKSFYNFKKIKNIIVGGKERQDSVYNGLISIKNANEYDIVIVHNASNPLVSQNDILNCIENASKYDSAVVGFPVKDTLKEVRNGTIKGTIDRSNLWQVQTPQAIKYNLFVKAFENAINKKLKFTDDVSLVEAIGERVKIVKCSNENIKITTPEDIAICEGIFIKRGSLENSAYDFKAGFGMDSHAFLDSNKDKPLILGGYKIPKEAGLKGDSDADVILHSLFNAISQSIGEKSLGFYATPLYKKGIKDSKEYIKIMLNKLKSSNYVLNNVGITIEASKPRLEQYSESIRDSLSKILNIKKEQIGLNFTSGDGLTEFGKGKGIQCFAVVTTKRF